MTTPLVARRSVVRNAIAGVGSTPAIKASPPAVADALDERVLEPLPRRTRVAPDDERGTPLSVAAEHDHAGSPEAVREILGELGARETADAVGAEQPFGSRREGYPSGFTPRTIAPCMPSVSSWVATISISPKPTRSSSARYSANESAPAMHPT